MSKKRRMFTIDLPQDDEVSPEVVSEDAESFPTGKTSRRGPMATAISETAESTRNRAIVEAEIRAENDALAAEHVRLKKAGLITDLLPLDMIETDKLVRDRAPKEDSELQELVQSIKDIGLSNPIQVEPRADGRFELIQGWRRLCAYRQLLDETGNADLWGKIPAGLSARGDGLDHLYRRMVDENLIRKDISFAEMAQLALRYAKDPDTGEADPDKAVTVLFKSAGYQKRSYIRKFIRLVEVLDDTLLYPADIPRSLGLLLAQRLDESPELAKAISAELSNWASRSVSEELDVLRRFAGQGADPQNAPETTSKVAVPSNKAKTTFQIRRSHGTAKCVAANGRLEIRLARDFSALDRRKLEIAVAALLDQLD